LIYFKTLYFIIGKVNGKSKKIWIFIVWLLFGMFVLIKIIILDMINLTKVMILDIEDNEEYIPSSDEK
jgi:hypothetical protein